MKKRNNAIRGRYLHYKGKYYDVLGEAIDVDSLNSYVIYKQRYGRGHWWIRPKEMFFEEIVVDNRKTSRFTWVDYNVHIPEVKGGKFKVKHTETGRVYVAIYKKFQNKYFLLLKNSVQQMKLEFIMIDNNDEFYAEIE